MAHKSDSHFSLETVEHSGLEPDIEENGSVYLFHHRTQREYKKRRYDDYFVDKYSDLCNKIPDDSIVCFLLDALSACDLISQLQGKLHYRLWIAIKRDRPVPNAGQLPDNHVALVV